MTAPEEEKLISLQDASKFCPYSQEYLSLRARQKKLQAVKRGRNWFTTEEWLKSYIAKSEEYKNAVNGNGKEATPPKTSQRIPFWQNVRLAFAIALVGVLLAAELFYDGREELVRGATKAAPLIVSSVAVLQQEARNTGLVLGNKVESSVFAASIGIQEIVREYTGLLREKFRAFASLFRRDLPGQPKQGLVVVPSKGSNERIKEQIQQSFSDEVWVTSLDKESGIITPVFRNRIGEDYLYILVPLQEQE